MKAADGGTEMSQGLIVGTVVEVLLVAEEAQAEGDAHKEWQAGEVEEGPMPAEDVSQSS